ncbi:MAG TPA: c-type cytochrome domain-containing protein [Verrucomicrobiae bacterium]|nr:c-type cytochrome domain-containing protein [Verrucomicrobiae bacterium]
MFAAETNVVQLPPPANQTVVFERDIRPILETSCIRCHGALKPKAHFRLDSRDAALKGGDNNSDDVVPGHSDKSQLILYVARAVPDMEMPPDDTNALTPQQVGLLRAWIDQGATWETPTNHLIQEAGTFAFSMDSTLRYINVNGDQQKFRELEGTKGDSAAEVGNFSLSQSNNHGDTFTAEGHARPKDNDYQLTLSLDKDEVGFVRGGFDEWRQYYDDSGGYYAGFTPPATSLNTNLFLDIGKFWVDFGLTVPRLPQITFGYEYQFRDGAKSMLDWNAVTQNGVTKNIGPNVEQIDEHTHVLKLDATYNWNDWNFEDTARGEFYHLGEFQTNAIAYIGNSFENTREGSHYALGVNTFRVGKQLKDWWLLSAGYLYSHYDGDSELNQTTTDSFGYAWDSDVVLRRDSHVVSAASLFHPAKYLSLSAGVQSEWTRQEGFGNVNLGFEDATAIPPVFLPFPGTVDANLDETEVQENLNLRFTRIRYTVLFADARFQQQSIGQFEQISGGTPEDFLRDTDADNNLYDVRAGFSTSPLRWLEFNADYHRSDSDTDYNHLEDESLVNGEGYSAFIRHRDLATDEVESKLVLHAATWLKCTLTYDWNSSDYFTDTDPISDLFAGVITPGGEIFAGHYQANTFGFAAVITPTPRLFFSESFTYSNTRTTTAQNGDPSLVPYNGNVYTLSANVGYALNAKTDLSANYSFSKADYSQDNAAAGLPLGIDFTRHELLIGLKRKFTKQLSGALRYQFSQYNEPSGGNLNNFTAHGIFATLSYVWH